MLSIISFTCPNASIATAQLSSKTCQPKRHGKSSLPRSDHLKAKRAAQCESPVLIHLCFLISADLSIFHSHRSEPEKARPNSFSFTSKGGSSGGVRPEMASFDMGCNHRQSLKCRATLPGVPACGMLGQTYHPLNAASSHPRFH